MNIFIIDSVSYPGAIGGSYFRAFKNLGAKIFVFDAFSMESKILFRTSNKFIPRAIRKVERFFLKFYIRESFKNWLYNLRNIKADLAIIFNNTLWINKEVIQEFKNMRPETLLFYLSSDNPFYLSPSFFNTLPLYDCILLYDKSIAPLLKEKGIKGKIEWLPFAWDPDLHYALKVSFKEIKIFGSDIAFIGKWWYNRENWLYNLSDFDLKIWGNNWERTKYSFLLKRWQRRPAIGQDYSKVCQASKIMLNFLQQNPTTHNMRTFEVPGCGGFLLTQRSQEQLEFFREDKEITCFSTPKELKEKIRYYLKHENQRRRIAICGHEKVKFHTYYYRAREIIKIYNQLKS